MEEISEIEEISKDLDALSIEIGVSKGRGNIIICTVNSPYFRGKILNFLAKRFTYDIINIKEGEGDEIIKKLRQKESEKDALIWIMPESMHSDVENALNNYRELFYEYPIPSIIFCNELFLQEIIKKAPDFWRYRGNFYRFKEPKGGDISSAFEILPINISFKTKKDLTRRIRINEHLLRIAKDKKQKVDLLLEIGIIYRIISKYEKALEYFNECLEITKEIGDRAGGSKCYADLGNVYADLGDFKKAIEFHEKSLKIFKEIGDRARESKCYTNLGAAYRNLGDFKKAIEFHEKSLKIFKEIGDKSGESACYGNLGAAYYSLGEFKKAIEFHEKSLKIAKEIGDKAGESRCYTNLGAVYHNLRNFNKAIEFYEKSVAIYKKTGELHNLKTVYENMSLSYQKMNNTEKAEEYKKMTEELAGKLRGLIR